MRIGRKEFDLSENCYIMGILNVTPDSFSDGGRYNNVDAAMKRIETMIAEGMDILDIGGESTRPGHEQISEQEELDRILPIIEAARRNFETPISLDAYRYNVVKAGVDAGVDLVNDIWGLKYDGGEMAALIAERDLPCVLMHNRDNAEYGNFFEELVSDMKQTLKIAAKAGIKKENIILDPGVGFAKSYENNLEAIDRLDEFRRRLGAPVLLGTSRKSVIGFALGLPVEERLEGTLATSVAGALKGASILRVHDIKENARAVKMTMAITKGYRNG